MFFSTKCIEEPQKYLNLRGRAGVSQGSVLDFFYVRCRGKPHCKTDAEIDRFLQETRMYWVHNQQTYMSNDYDDQD